MLTETLGESFARQRKWMQIVLGLSASVGRSLKQSWRVSKHPASLFFLKSCVHKQWRPLFRLTAFYPFPTERFPLANHNMGASLCLPAPQCNVVDGGEISSKLIMLSCDSLDLGNYTYIMREQERVSHLLRFSTSLLQKFISEGGAEEETSQKKRNEAKEVVERECPLLFLSFFHLSRGNCSTV